VGADGLQLEGFDSRNSVRQWRLFGVVTQPADDGDPGTCQTEVSRLLYTTEVRSDSSWRHAYLHYQDSVAALRKKVIWV
jgi:hypothetical protein